MEDTSPEMRKKHAEFFMAMGPEERFRIGLQMSDDVYDMVKERVILKYPGIKGKQLALQMFLEYYQKEFSKEEINRIIQYFNNLEE